MSKMNQKGIFKRFFLRFTFLGCSSDSGDDICTAASSAVIGFTKTFAIPVSIILGICTSLSVVEKLKYTIVIIEGANSTQCLEGR